MNFGDEIRMRLFNGCPLCGRRKMKVNEICASCKHPRKKKYYNDTIRNPQKHCQYSKCSQHLEMFDRKKMIKFTKAREIFYFCTEICKERFKNEVME